MNTGNKWVSEVMSIILERERPRMPPKIVEAVNWETLFPEMSPMLFLLAN